MIGSAIQEMADQKVFCRNGLLRAPIQKREMMPQQVSHLTLLSVGQVFSEKYTCFLLTFCKCDLLQVRTSSKYLKIQKDLTFYITSNTRLLLMTRKHIESQIQVIHLCC